MVHNYWVTKLCLLFSFAFAISLFRKFLVLKYHSGSYLLQMDATTPKYSKTRYDEIVKEVSSYLKKVSYNTEKVPFVPTSAFEGDKVIERSKNKGPTLLQALDQITEPKRPSDNWYPQA